MIILAATGITDEQFGELVEQAWTYFEQEEQYQLDRRQIHQKPVDPWLYQDQQELITAEKFRDHDAVQRVLDKYRLLDEAARRRQASRTASKMNMPAIWYHGTNSDALDSIRENGLYNPCLTTVYEVAKEYALAKSGHGHPIILHVSLPNTAALTVDEASLKEPVGWTGVTGASLDKAVENLRLQGSISATDWQKTYPITKTVLYNGIIPPKFIQSVKSAQSQRQSSSLYQQLMALRPQMAEAAQRVYNEWEQDESGQDEMLGSGGICDQIAEEIGSVIVSNITDVELNEAGQDGDDHAANIVALGNENYYVDIPSYIYERGSGYRWTKIPGVVFGPQHIVVERI